MCNNVFRGLGVALVTPFSADGGVDFASLSGLVDYVVAGGADFVCALGSTAETPCLSVRERMAVKDAVVGAVGGRVPVLLGMGGNDTGALCEEIGCFDFSGVSGILSVVPFYNRPSQRGIYEHFGRVAEAVEPSKGTKGSRAEACLSKTFHVEQRAKKIGPRRAE